MSASAEPWTVVKVGGSLYDLPDLQKRLHGWLMARDETRILLFPGGGITADVIRRFDEIHGLGEEAAHWLAIRCLSLNAHFLQKLLPTASLTPVIPPTSTIPTTFRSWFLLDAHAFFRMDEEDPDHLPHHWQVTSDSLALRLAILAQARELILLKSNDWQGTDWNQASRLQVVDGYFSEVLRRAPAGLQIRIVNLRA